MASSYYVSGNIGNDSTGNGTESLPWKKISVALSKIKANNEGPGVTLYVMNSDAGYYEVVDVDIIGTAAAYFTIKNYPGHSPTVDGRAGVDSLNSGLPSGPLDALSNPFTGAKSSWNPLVRISGQYINWEGINVRRSLGRGIIVVDGSINPKYINIKDCSVNWNRSVNILITDDGKVANKPQYIEVDGVESYEAGTIIRSRTRGGRNHPGNISVRGGSYVTVKNCTVHSTWTEGIMIDANQGNSSNCTIEDNVVYDTMNASIFAHAANNLVVQRNYIFRSATDKARSNPYGPAVSIAVSSQENSNHTLHRLNGCKIVNNIIAYASKIGIRNKADGRPGMDNVTIANNTLVGNTTGISSSEPANSTDLIIENNIIYLCSTLIDGAALKATFDYNCWGSDVAAKYRGANDVIGNPGLVNATNRPDVNNIHPEYYAVDTGGAVLGQGANLAAEFATAPAADVQDYWGSARSAPWDIGAHEYGGVGGPVATAGASVNSGVAPLSVDFTGAGAGGTAPYTYSWTFGDGGTSTSQNPTYIYQNNGVYTATLKVTDDSPENLFDTDTEVITVSAEPTTSGAVTCEQVIFSAGDATYTVSGTPKQIWFFYGGGKVDGTTASDAQLGAGGYVAADGSQYALGTCSADNATPTGTAVNMVSGAAILLMNPDQTVLARGVVSSVTTTTVSLSWTGTTASEEMVSLNWYGPGVSNAASEELYLGAPGDTATFSGDYTHIFMPANLRGLDHAYGHVDASIGLAIKGGMQACLGWGSDDNVSTPSQYGKLSTNRVATRPRGGRELEITTWISSGVTFTLSGGDINGNVVVFGLNIAETDTYLAVEDTPVATGNTDYTDSGIDGQISISLLSNLTSTDTVETGSGAGVAGITVVDVDDVDRTIIKSSDDSATAAPSVEKSFTEANYTLVNELGTMIDEGAATIITGGHRLNLTTAGGTAYKSLNFLVENTSVATTGPRASFDYSPANPTYSDTITFTDNSSANVDDITGWDWDFGDGSAHATTQDTTHSYTVAGTYTVTLEVTDDGAATDEISRDINVSAPAEHVIAYSISPLSGAAPLTVTLDASSSVAAGNESFDEDATIWSIWDTNVLSGKGSDVSYIANGITTSVSIDKTGTYLIELYMKTTSGEEMSVWPSWEEGGITVYIDPEIDFDSQHGEIITTGSYTADFEATSNRSDIDSALITWDFGDGNTSSSSGLTTVSHTYPALYYVDFNGTTSEINCGSDAALDDLHDAAMTIEAWIKADGLGEGSAGVIACKTSDGTGGWVLGISSDGLAASIDCATTDALSDSGSGELAADSAWHHVAMTWDDASFTYPKLWIDGTESSYNSTQNRSGAIVTDAAQSFIIGNRGDGSKTWDGGIAWVRVSDAVLYTTTFTPPSRGSTPESTANTLEQWYLNDGSGTTADATEDTPANDGTITDGSWLETDTSYAYDVAMTVALPEGDEVLTKTDYITIVPTPIAPPSVPTLVSDVALLASIATDVELHAGCMPDATWVQDGTYPKVYTATLSRIWADGYTITVYEDGVALTSKASIALCNGTAGSYHVSFFTEALVSVHTTNTDNPGSNASHYSLRFT